jgi:SET domain-containing protein
MNYKPLPESVTIKSSPIHGLGLFAVKVIPKNTDLGMMHLVLENMYDIKQREIIRTPVGGHVNHSEDANCERVEVKIYRWHLKTIKEVKKGEELTLKYTMYKVDKTD